jgi:hypothetical protein
MLRMHTEEILVPGKRLGRLVAHDPRSKDHPAAMASEIKSVLWERNVPPFDQGEVGSCTGNAAAGCLSTQPFTNKFDQRKALELYSQATRLDRIKGVYPPIDTGSSGLAVMRAAVKLKLIEGYSHAFGIEHALKALQLGPGIVGMTWLTGCDNPDPGGFVKYDGEARGGHEVELFMVDMKEKFVGFWNSWGSRFGDGGRFYMTLPDFEHALVMRGDVTFPRVAK